MKGCLIVNAYLTQGKFDEIHQYLRDAFVAKGMFLELITNQQALRLTFSKNLQFDFVLFWDKDVYLCELLENMGYRVFNSSNAIAVCDDKALTYLRLMKHGIKMPRTIFAPMTYANIGYTDFGFVELAGVQLGYPIMIKENFGSFGQQVYLAGSYSDALEIVKKIGSKPFLFQEFISSSFGKDIRVQVVGGKIVASVLRTAKEGEFKANVTSGGTMSKYELSDEQREMALRACEVLGLDFAGVDLLFGEGEQPILCEVNSNAHFKNLFDCTGVNVAESIADYVRCKIWKK
jgi:RimK family alpha-L-glutamate ligase